MQNNFVVPKLLEKSILFGPDNRSIFVLEEKKKKWIGKNINKKIGFTFQIDKDLIKSVETKKCDKGLFLENKYIYLVELKGVDFNTACKQLKVTLDFFKENLGNSYTYFCRVVGKEIPKKDNYPYSYRLLLSNLHKSKISFEAKSQILEENIERKFHF